jgi:hypothetical protein
MTSSAGIAKCSLGAILILLAGPGIVSPAVHPHPDRKCQAGGNPCTPLPAAPACPPAVAIGTGRYECPPLPATILNPAFGTCVPQRNATCFSGWAYCYVKTNCRMAVGSQTWGTCIRVTVGADTSDTRIGCSINGGKDTTTYEQPLAETPEQGGGGSTPRGSRGLGLSTN